MEKTNNLTSRQALSWARSMEGQRSQKVILHATKENNEFNAIKKADQNNKYHHITKKYRIRPQWNCKYCGSICKHGRCPLFGRVPQDVAVQTTLKMFAETPTSLSQEKQTELCRTVHERWQYNEETEVPMRNFNAVRSNIFKFHSKRAVIVTKFKMKSCQKQCYANIK